LSGGFPAIYVVARSKLVSLRVLLSFRVRVKLVLT
jgi:hypothetical protein